MKNCGVLEKRAKAKAYHRGDHPVKNRDPNPGTLVFNKFAQIGRNRTAHIITKKPKWRFLPKQEGAIYAAEAVSNILNDVIWEKIEWDKKSEADVNEARDAGTSHIKIFLCKDGFPDAIPLTAPEIIVDPKAKKKKHLRFWCHVYPMGIQAIEQIYGVKVASDEELESMRVKSHTADASYNKTDANTAPAVVFRNVKWKATGWMPDIIGRATVYELWLEDKTLEAISYRKEETIAEHENVLKGIAIEVHPMENHPNHIRDHEKFLATLDEKKDAASIILLADHIEEHLTFPQETKREKYPFGRKIVYTGKVLLEDKPNPIAAEMSVGIDFRDLLIKWDYDPVDDEYWGKSGMADAFDPQDVFNHRKNAITQGINRLNHGLKKINQRAAKGIKGNLMGFANWIGIGIPVTHPDDIVVDYGPQMPSQIFDDLIHSEQFIDEVD